MKGVLYDIKMYFKTLCLKQVLKSTRPPFSPSLIIFLEVLRIASYHGDENEKSIEGVWGLVGESRGENSVASATGQLS